MARTAQPAATRGITRTPLFDASGSPTRAGSRFLNDVAALLTNLQQLAPGAVVTAGATPGTVSDIVGESGAVTITYVSDVTLNSLGGGGYSLTVTKKTITFSNGVETAHT